MKRAIFVIFDACILVGGVLLVVWATVTWKSIGFKFIPYDPGPTDSNFFKLAVAYGLGAVVCGYLSLRFHLGKANKIVRRGRRKNVAPSGEQGIGFASQFEAKRFFVDKIVTQAQQEDIPLSEPLRYMLSWTEIEEGFRIDEELSERFHAETTDEEYEKKICLLLKHAYSNDIIANPAMKETYRNAYRAMKDHDHYILVMIKDSLGSKLK